MVLPWSSSAPAREGLSGSLFYDCQQRIIFQSHLKEGSSRLLFSDPVDIQVEEGLNAKRRFLLSLYCILRSLHLFTNPKLL
jgi:hypothetical protein